MKALLLQQPARRFRQPLRTSQIMMDASAPAITTNRHPLRPNHICGTSHHDISDGRNREKLNLVRKSKKGAGAKVSRYPLCQIGINGDQFNAEAVMPTIKRKRSPILPDAETPATRENSPVPEQGIHKKVARRQCDQHRAGSRLAPIKSPRKVGGRKTRAWSAIPNTPCWPVWKMPSAMRPALM